EQACDRRRDGACCEQDDHRGEHHQRARRARAERHRPPDEPGLVHDQHLRVVEVLLERAPGALEQQGVADRERRLARHVLPPALDGEHHEVAPLGTIPQNARSPTSSERGGMTISTRPERRVSRTPSASSPYWSTSVRACSLKSREPARGLRVGTSRSPKRTTIAIVPATSGTPTR